MGSGVIVVLTGAGISAESGVPTFRDANGLWEGHEVTDVATPEGFAANPDLVHSFYDTRRRLLADVQPNPAHLALARLEATYDGELVIVTQNIDDLHERAGSHSVVHMHGRLRSALCTDCGGQSPWDGDLADRPSCPSCGRPALRPDVVWFGEIPYDMEYIQQALAACDEFVSIGTSGAVYPAAGFMSFAAATGARTLEINLEPSAGSTGFDQSRRGPAGILVPEWVDEVLARR